jgi:hypothetical protein
MRPPPEAIRKIGEEGSRGRTDLTRSLRSIVIGLLYVRVSQNRAVPSLDPNLFMLEKIITIKITPPLSRFIVLLSFFFAIEILNIKKQVIKYQCKVE